MNLRLWFATALLASSGSAATIERLAYEPGEGVNLRVHGDALELRLGTRLMLDGAYFDDADEESARGELRRARLSLSGRIGDAWRLSASYEAGGRSPAWKDAWVRYQGFESARFRIGQFQEPFSLDELTSSGNLLFVERALPNALAPGYHLGVELSLPRDRWGTSLGVFGGSIDERDAGWGSSLRWTAAPRLDERGWIHLGVSASYREPGTRGLRFRPRPEAHLGTRLVDTGRMREVARLASGAIELGMGQGPWTIEAEWIGSRVVVPGDVLRFEGAYLATAWLLTGESHGYSPGAGRLGGVRPRGRIAFEIAARASSIDLDAGSVRGGRQHNVTLGLNAYFGEGLRWMLDVVRSEAHGEDGTTVTRALLARVQWSL